MQINCPVVILGLFWFHLKALSSLWAGTHLLCALRGGSCLWPVGQTGGSLLPVLALWRVCLGDLRVLCLSFRMWSTCLLGLLHRFTEGIYRRMILALGCLRSSPLFTTLLLWNIPYALVSMNVTHSCNYRQRTDRFKRTLLGLSRWLCVSWDTRWLSRGST